MASDNKGIAKRLIGFVAAAQQQGHGDTFEEIVAEVWLHLTTTNVMRSTSRSRSCAGSSPLGEPPDTHHRLSFPPALAALEPGVKAIVVFYRPRLFTSSVAFQLHSYLICVPTSYPKH